MTHEKYCIRLNWPGVESCDVCAAIQAAVAEQKERDANVAGNIMWQRFGNELDRWSGARQAAATEIAAAIREQP